MPSRRAFFLFGELMTNAQDRTLKAMTNPQHYADHIMRGDATIEEPGRGAEDPAHPTESERADAACRAHASYGQGTHLFLERGTTVEAWPIPVETPAETPVV